MATIPITNGGWETGNFSGWSYTYSGAHSGLLTVSSVNKHSGTYSVRFASPFAGTEYGRLDQSIVDWEQYKGYTVKWELWSKVDFQGQADALRVRISDGVTDPDNYIEWAWNAYESAWTKHTGSYVFPANATEFTIRIWADWKWPNQLADMYGYFDDFSLETVESSPAKNRVLIIP